MTTELVTQTADLEKIKTGLEAFNERRDTIAQLAESATTLDVTDINDRQGLKLVVDKRKELKKARIEIEKEGKAMRDLIAPVTRFILNSEKELVALIEPQEKRLKEREEWVESEKERIRLEEISKEEARIQSRIDSLSAFGFEIDYADIKAMSDETFSKYLEAARVQFEKEQAEKEEQERLRLEQEERERLEREAEAKRMEEERAELLRQREEAEAAQRKLQAEMAAMEAEKERIENEKKELIFQSRRNELEAIGFYDVFKDNIYSEGITAATLHDIRDQNQEEWNSFIGSLKASIEKVNKDKGEAEKKRIQELAEIEERARMKAKQDAEDEANRLKEKEAADRLAAEKKAAREPDKVKLKAYALAVKSVPVPEMKTQEGRIVLAALQELIQRFDNFATERTEAL